MTKQRTRHTPGPWRLTGPCPTDPAVFNVRSDHHRHGDGALLFTTGPMFNAYKADPKETKANARLAAEAPEMLALLLEVRDWVLQANDEGDEPWLARADATIWAVHSGRAP